MARPRIVGPLGSVDKKKTYVVISEVAQENADDCVYRLVGSRQMFGGERFFQGFKCLDQLIVLAQRATLDPMARDR